jgi:hypothetical protein
MADIGQSSAVTTSTTPDWYTNSMKNLAAGATQYGVNGPNAPQYVGATDLQNKGFDLSSANVGNYKPDLDTAGNLINKGAAVDITGAANPYLTAGTSSSADLVGGYMNPYTQNVVDQIRMANQQNIAQNLSPGITAGAVGSGQFGSQRGANALALGISNANIGALAQQASALQSGYSDALKAAQAQRANQVNAGQIAGNMATAEAQKNRDLATSSMNLGSQRQTSGLTDVNQLLTTGAQKQQIEQNKQLFPLDVLNKQATILSGAQVPVSTTKTMDASTLSQISGIAALGAAAFAPGPSVTVTNPDGTKTTTPGLSYVDKLVNWFKSGQQGPAPVAPAGTGTGGGTGGGGAASDTIAPDGKGGFIDTSTGLPVNADGTPLTGTGGGAGGGGAGAGTIAGGHWDESTDPWTWVPD